MAKDGGDLGLARWILAALTSGWLVPTNSPRAAAAGRTGDGSQQASRDGEETGTFEESLAAAEVGRHAWEWKEGRLLAYELVLNGLLNNHTAVLFPSLVRSSVSPLCVLAARPSNIIRRLFQAQALSPRTLPSPILLHSPA